MSWVVTWKGALVSYGVACVVFTVGWVIFRAPARRQRDAEELAALRTAKPWLFISDEDVNAVVDAAEFMCRVEAQRTAFERWLCHCPVPVPTDIGECQSCHRLVDPRRAAE